MEIVQPGGAGITLKTNNVTNGSQTVLNLLSGSGITLSDNGIGGITISSTGLNSPETPTGTINGVNTTFTVVNTPKWISVDGLNKFVTANYTYVAPTITITDGAPPVLSIMSFY